MREIVLDTETTGLNPSQERIVEIACVELINRCPSGNFWQIYLDPECPMPEGARRIHGLSTEFLRGKPKFAERVDEFLEFISDSPLVIHNASFDVGFLNAELDRCNLSKLSNSIVDTIALARSKFGGAPASLDALCRRFRIDNTARTVHGALLDAQLLADVYLELKGGRQSELAITAKSGSSVQQSTTDTYNETESTIATDEAGITRPATASEMADHSITVAKLGDTAIWHKWMKQ